MTLLVFEAPPQEGLVRSVPATLGVRSFHRFPAYVPLTFHRFLRAEWSQQEDMFGHRGPRQFDGALGPGNGESGRARAAHGGSCRICLLRAVHRADIFVDRPENRRTVTRLREALLSLFSALERAMDLNSKAPLTLLTTRDQHSLDERATSVALPVSENTLRQGVR